MFAGLPGGQSGGAGGSGGGVIGEDASQTAGNVWNAVKGWASAAGSKVAEAEAVAWKKIEGKKWLHVHWNKGYDLDNLDLVQQVTA
jgi:hypothetical protein